MIWLQIITTVFIYGVIVVDLATIIADMIEKKNRQNDKYKTDCNSCALLSQKNHWNMCEYKYICKKHGGFYKPPIICADYKKRNKEE